MQLKNMLTQLAICSLVILFSTTIVKPKGNPIKPRMRRNLSASATEFVCGVYKGSEREILWHYYQHQANLKNLKKTGARLNSRNFVLNDVAVIEDDGSVLISGARPEDDVSPFDILCEHRPDAVSRFEVLTNDRPLAAKSPG